MREEDDNRGSHFLERSSSRNGPLLDWFALVEVRIKARLVSFDLFWWMLFHVTDAYVVASPSPRLAPHILAREELQGPPPPRISVHKESSEEGGGIQGT